MAGPRIRRMGQPTQRQKPELRRLAMWSTILDVPMMQMKFVLHKQPQFESIRENEVFTPDEARELAAAARAVKW